MSGLFITLTAGFWVETTPQDFMDGWYDPLLYVSRRLQKETNPADSGAVEFYARFDANGDGYYDLVSADWSGPYLRLWWGSATGYSSTNFRAFPVNNGNNCDMADLNLDGWPELIHSGDQTESLCRIYWGSEAAGGPDPNSSTTLPWPSGGSESVYVYDLDKDTYLDIILGASGSPGGLRIYWGGPGGYNPSNYSERISGIGPVVHNIDISDLNKDGYPDIATPRQGSGWGVNVLWGDATPRNLTDNPLWYHEAGTSLNSHGMTLADLNNDGWLDIVSSQFAGGSGDSSRIYFSNQGSFEPLNTVSLNTGSTYGGTAAWDFNGDGWLDLIFFRGYGTNEGLYLYLNAGSPPYFSDPDRVMFGHAVSYSGGFVFDFNRDGKADVFANVGPDWDTSRVYWGVQETGVYDSVQSLKTTSAPVRGDHHGTFRECGNIYDRNPMAWYESGVFSSADLQAEASVSWIAWDSAQIGSEILMYIRTRWDGSSPWTSWRQVSNGETVSENPYFPARDIQYRAEFRWVNPAWLPWLERVEVRTTPLTAEEGYSDKPGLRYGTGNGTVWVSWPRANAEVSLYSADGRMLGSKMLVNGRAEFKELRPGVYYLWIEAEGTAIREKALVR